LYLLFILALVFLLYRLFNVLVISYNGRIWITESNNRSTATVPSGNNRIACDGLVSQQTDPITGYDVYNAREVLELSSGNGKALGVYVLGYNNAVALSIEAIGAGNCIDRQKKAQFLLRDGSRIAFRHDGLANCRGIFEVFLTNAISDRRALNLLSREQVAALRVHTSSGYVEQRLNTSESERLLTTLQCVQNNHH
jgi:hypothetical protein